MKTTVITESVKIETLQTTTSEQLLDKADVINSFLKNQDGFIDAELVKAIEGNTWYFVYHIDNIEKFKAIGEKLRGSRLFNEISPLIDLGGPCVTFFEQVERW
jgi:hypothetical protein